MILELNEDEFLYFKLVERQCVTLNLFLSCVEVPLFQNVELNEV